MSTRATKGTQLVGAINIGGKKTVKGVLNSTVAIDPGSIAAATRAAVTFTLTGAKAGDALVLQPPAGLHDDLLFVGCEVTADDTGTVYLYNPTGSAIDDASATWRYTLLDLT